MAIHVRDLADFLETFAPSRLAESWDNVGLLVGDMAAAVERAMTCLTITPTTVREAIDGKAQLIVTHHPFPFRPLKQLTSATPEGRMLLELIAAGVAVYSPHTAFDSAAEGINARLAEGIGLQNVQVLLPADDGALGAGRWGEYATKQSLGDVIDRVKNFLDIPQLHIVGTLTSSVRAVGVACGSAGEFLAPARDAGCQCLVTGEVRFHTALEAEASGIALILAGHFASERFALDALAKILAEQFPSVAVWASKQERDPLQLV
jgi:dinuclear metal center YbgI/SA1388 family protein